MRGRRWNDNRGLCDRNLLQCCSSFFDEQKLVVTLRTNYFDAPSFLRSLAGGESFSAGCLGEEWEELLESRMCGLPRLLAAERGTAAYAY